MKSCGVPIIATRSRVIGLASIVAFGIIGGLAGAAVAQENDVLEGQKIWQQKAQCPQCHGWAGDGKGGMHSPGGAPSLRTTKLTRDEIRLTIQCGRPGTPMPHFDRFAYTDKRCYNLTAEDLGDSVPDRGSITLQAPEIDALADYIAAKIQGAGAVTRAQCKDFFKANAGSRCDTYPDAEPGSNASASKG
jgi:mono/diheme cytochrome c family protein